MIQPSSFSDMVSLYIWIIAFELQGTTNNLAHFCDFVGGKTEDKKGVTSTTDLTNLWESQDKHHNLLSSISKFLHPPTCPNPAVFC